jgi:hypothetical protein
VTKVTKAILERKDLEDYKVLLALQVSQVLLVLLELKAIEAKQDLAV